MHTRIRWQNAGRLMAVLAAAGLFWWSRTWLWQAAGQLFWGMLLALAALPLTKRLERRMPSGLSAAIALGTLLAVVSGMLVLFAPPLVRQGREIGQMLPGLYNSLELAGMRAQALLGRIGLKWQNDFRQTLYARGQELLGAAIPAAAGWLKNAAGSFGKWMLSPVFAFYFLRDRRWIGEWLMALVPVGGRRLSVRILQEMRRETAGYLRGQLMACAVVGILSALGLLCCGIPAWLFLGVMIGILEFVPYIGPFLGGVLAILFALPGGMARTLWTTGVVIAVQQLEGMVLSPKLMSEATRLHPLAVILCTMTGGAAAGFAGVLLAVPLLLCLRAALRVFSLRRFDQ